MPSIGHMAVGLAGARASAAPRGLRVWMWTLFLVTVSYLPDLDVLAFCVGIPYQAPFGHRGAFHSVVLAGGVGALVGVLAALLKRSGLRVGVAVGLVMASHGVLDAFTDGGLGIALAWPFSSTRFLATWRPIPAAPLGWRLLSQHGAALMLHESLLFLPLFVVAAWPRRTTTGQERAA